MKKMKMEIKLRKPRGRMVPLNKEEEDNNTTSEPAQSWEKRRQQLRDKREIYAKANKEKKWTWSFKARLSSATSYQKLLCKVTYNISQEICSSFFVIL